MNIVKFAEPVTVKFKKSAGEVTHVFEALRDYIIATVQMDRIMQDENIRNRLYKCTRLEPRLEPFHVQAKKSGSQRLLLYNGSGGYGDQITTWPIARWLATQGYEIHVLTDPGNQPCWYNFPWVKTINTTPFAYEHFKLFDYHLVWEQLNNQDEHQDQLHPVDLMFHRMGVDYKTVDPKMKAIHPIFTWAEMNSVNNFAHRAKIGFYQLAAANGVRALSPNDSAFLIQKLAEEFGDTHWLACYDQFIPDTYVKALACRTCNGTGIVVQPEQKGEAPACPDCKGSKVLAPNIEPYCAPSLRELWALVHKRASVVVAPDSMFVHLAGSMQIPCVGLWGPIAPGHRVAYYANHTAIWHRDACPHSPCFAYTASFPKYCPPRGGAARTVCEVVSAVTPSEVVDAVKKIRR